MSTALFRFLHSIFLVGWFGILVLFCSETVLHVLGGTALGGEYFILSSLTYLPLLTGMIRETFYESTEENHVSRRNILAHMLFIILLALVLASISVPFAVIAWTVYIFITLFLPIQSALQFVIALSVGWFALTLGLLGSVEYAHIFVVGMYIFGGIAILSRIGEMFFGKMRRMY